MIIIPARLSSSRLPNKVLADINGIPMVIRTALTAQKVDDTVIATDSEEVKKIAKKYGLSKNDIYSRAVEIKQML